MERAQGASERSSTTVLIGRDEELHVMDVWLSDATAGPLVITGPGGIGKTALLREFLVRVSNAFLVDASNANTVEDLFGSLAEALGIASGTPTPEMIRRSLHRKGVLVLALDNLEQFATSVRGTGPSDLAPLFSLTPKTLATSRVRLGLPHEQHILLGPLVADAPSSPAVQLLRRRTDLLRSSEQEDPLLLRVARLTDGIPLALELAATKISTFGLAWTEERLARGLLGLRASAPSGEARQKTLDECVQWSWELLSSDDRQDLAKLSLFSGAFSIGDAEKVLRVDGDRAEVLLETLTTQSLLFLPKAGEPAFRLPIAVREYARRVLETLPLRDEVFESYADVVLDSAEGSGAHFYGPDHAASFSAFERLRPDLLAIATAWRDRDSSQGMQASARSVFRALQVLGEAALAGTAPGPYLRTIASARATAMFEELDEADRRAALILRSEVVRTFTSASDAVSFAEEALRIDPQDRVGRGRALLALSKSLRKTDSGDGAYALALEALDLARDAGNEPLRCEALAWLGRVARAQHFFAEARAFASEGIALARSLKDDRNIVQISTNLGSLLYDLGDLKQAAALYHEAIAHSFGRTAQQVNMRIGLADILVSDHRLDEATEQLSIAQQGAEQRGHPSTLVLVAINYAILSLARGDFEKAREAVQRATANDEGTSAWSANLSLALFAVTNAHLGLFERADDEALKASAKVATGVGGAQVRLLLLGYELARWAVSDPEWPAAKGRIDDTLDVVFRGDEHGKSLHSESGDIRLMFQLVERELLKRGFSIPKASARPELVLSADANVASLGSKTLDLGAHHAPRRVLQALATTDQSGLSVDELFLAGWPGEKSVGQTARDRVYVAVSLLRKKLLGPLLARGEHGYYLDCPRRIES